MIGLSDETRMTIARRWSNSRERHLGDSDMSDHQTINDVQQGSNRPTP